LDDVTRKQVEKTLIINEYKKSNAKLFSDLENP
jgi:hypothetical protein